MTKLLTLPVFLGVYWLTTLSTPSVAGSSNVILRANFDGDAVNAPPDLTLPGPPPGDFLVLNESSGTVRVRNTVGTLVNKPIEMNQVPGVGGVNVFAFVGPGLDCDTVLVQWRSLARSDTVVLLNCHAREFANTIFSLDYRRNGVLTYNAAGAVLPVTYTPDVHQDFEVLVDFATQTTSLRVDGVAMAGFQNVPFLEAAASLTRMHFSGGGTRAQDFAFDDILITEIGTCGPVAVESATWGAIKVLYSD